jgi:hypothetical protein
MNTPKIKVAGEELTLNLSTNYFYKFFYQITGIDLVAHPTIPDAEGIKMFDYAAAFIAAGYKANCKIEGQEEKLTKETIEHLINSMELDEAGRIVVELVALMNADTKGDNDSSKKKATKTLKQVG